MLSPHNVPDVDPAEMLSCFAMFGGHLRAEGTVRPDTFIPHPHRELSVTRHLELAPSEIWIIGCSAAEKRGKALLGKADLIATAYTDHQLLTVAAPVAGNANHVNVTDWPAQKPLQKSIAQKLGAQAVFTPAPPPEFASSAVDDG